MLKYFPLHSNGSKLHARDNLHLTLINDSQLSKMKK